MTKHGGEQRRRGRLRGSRRGTDRASERAGDRHGDRDGAEEDRLSERLTQQLAHQWALLRAERRTEVRPIETGPSNFRPAQVPWALDLAASWAWRFLDRKSTRLNSSH